MLGKGTSNTMQLDAELQRYGRNKSTIVDHSYVESGEYRRKFDLISDNVSLNKLIYDLSKKMLYHRSGTLLEDMYWIDTDVCQVIAKEVNCKIEQRISYSKATKKAIKRHEHILTIHSHPMSGPPSSEDLNYNLKFGYDIGIICCHDGRIFTYVSNQHINTLYYNLLVGSYEKSGYGFIDAQIAALDEIQKKYDIIVKEVLL